MTHGFHYAKTMARDCLVRFARVTKRASLGRALLALRRDEVAELLLPSMDL